MSTLSIIVPRIGLAGDSHFEATLASVLRYRLPRHQVIVVHRSDQPDDYGLRDEVDFVACENSRSLGGFMNAALPRVRGAILALLRPGVEVHNHWFTHGVRILTSGEAGCVSVPLAASDDSASPVSRGIATNRRMTPRHADRRQTPAGPHSHAGFYRRDLLERIGPIDEWLCDELMGLDVALAMASLGYRCAVAEELVLRIRFAEMIRYDSSFALGRDARRLVHRHARPGGSPLVPFGCALELVSDLVRPGRWTMLAGRGAARRRHATDVGFAARLASLAHAREARTGNPRVPAGDARRAA